MRASSPRQNRHKIAKESETTRKDIRKVIKRLISERLEPKARDILSRIEKRGYSKKDSVLRREVETL